MDFDEFKGSVRRSRKPPAELGPPLASLWLDASGDWDAAHAAVQADESEAAAWVHAYLHRKEGDLRNARYWYRRAEQTPAETSLEAEWESVARALLSAAH